MPHVILVGRFVGLDLRSDEVFVDTVGGTVRVRIVRNRTWRCCVREIE